MSDYLNTGKSVMISAPAGSGKTEKLARRYIALLKSGVDLQRILAITFTDKAATEMKQRILKILKEEDQELFKAVLDRMPLMRVTTFHSFCGTLLRRFSFEAEIDPNYRVEDAIDSEMVWEDMLYEVLMEAAGGARGHELILQTLGEKGFRGLDYLKNTADYLYLKNPFSLRAETFIPLRVTPAEIIKELKSWQGVGDILEGYDTLFQDGPAERIISFEQYFLTATYAPRKRPVPALKNIPDYQDWALKMFMYWKDIKVESFADRTERIREIYQSCLRKYTARKKMKGSLDFSDLEYLSYRMLTENPEWANILYAFDEKTDHILVDEFQDTNTFQWGIINSLTEEWRSGIGAKRDDGTQPTVFFVGDEKQSIYFFRGANVEIFQRAKNKLEEWLGEEFLYEEIRENYRSRPAIIEFTNHVFSRIMEAGGKDFPWITKYTEFHAFRSSIPDAGRVELILLDDEAENTLKAKQNEAECLAMRIKGLAGNYQIAERGLQQQRPCKYMDMAVLLRKRTHLKRYEEAFRRHNIPFVAVKGVGFYQEPEVSMLRAFIYFLSNPRDDYSLYVLLKSPLFRIDESAIIGLIDNDEDCLFSKLLALSPHSPCLLEGPASMLNEWSGRLAHEPLPTIIEEALVKTGAWEFFHEPQRRANIKKFIRIIEDLEANGKSLLKIRDFLEKTFDKSAEAKANVNTEGMDAVKIMTIHASKGLEFPLVFVAGIDEPFMLKTGENLVYEKDGGFYFKSEPEASIRKQDEDFLIHLAREEEEQKRLFYVAATRAEEALFLIGHWDSRGSSFLDLLKAGLGLEKLDQEIITDANIPGLSILTGSDVAMLYHHAAGPVQTENPPKPSLTVTPVSVMKQAPWAAVTETLEIKKHHGKDWTSLGDVIHRIFEGVSKGFIKEQDIRTRAVKLLQSKGFFRDEQKGKLLTIENQIETLREKGIWQEIILPAEGSFSELPFVLQDKDIVYSGRVDRIIKGGDVYKIYDYKTFPVKKDETEYLLKKYSVQMNIYKRASVELFSTQNVRTYVVFTHTGEIRET